jgi:xylitol oxidase
VVASVEAALAPFAARPHWGKVFVLPPGRVARLYPRMDDFRKVTRELDPAGKFSNAMLERIPLQVEGSIYPD